MEDSRSLALLALFAATPLLAVVATAAARRTSTRRALFFVVSLLCLAGLFSELKAAVLSFYPSPWSPSNAAPNLLHVLVITDMLTLAVGLPLLLWLHNAFRRT